MKTWTKKCIDCAEYFTQRLEFSNEAVCIKCREKREYREQINDVTNWQLYPDCIKD